MECGAQVPLPREVVSARKTRNQRSVDADRGKRPGLMQGEGGGEHKKRCIVENEIQGPVWKRATFRMS